MIRLSRKDNLHDGELKLSCKKLCFYCSWNIDDTGASALANYLTKDRIYVIRANSDTMPRIREMIAKYKKWGIL